MAKKYVSDLLREAKNSKDYADYLDKLAEALDSDKKLYDSVKKATDTMMTAGVLRGAATLLKEHSKFMEDIVSGVAIDWPPKPNDIGK